MFKVNKLTWAIGCALVIGGCALPFQSKVASLNDLEVKPVERINHAGYKPKIMYLLGRYYQGKVQYDKAIDAYHKALALEPNYVEVHNGLAIIYAVQGDFDLSFEHFSKAMALMPEKSYLHNNLGYAYLKQGREQEALEAFNRALQFDPENTRAHKNFVTVANRLGLNGENMLATAVSESTQVGLQSPPVEQYEKHDVSAQGGGLIQVAANVYALQDEKHVQHKPVFENSNGERGDRDVAIHKTTAQDAERGQLRSVRIEVSNGNGISGMARQVSEYLGRYGAADVRLTNHETFFHDATEIYFRSGSIQHASQLNQVLPKPVKLIETNELRNDIQVKVLLGGDFSRETAYFGSSERMQVSALSDQ